MPTRPSLHRSRHALMPEESKRARDRAADALRGSARQRGYDGRWDKARRLFLAEHPFCRMCREQGTLTPATVVDHVVPHRGDPTLFWDRRNWQALCKRHHDGEKQRLERRSK
jgi:5-methylcytosine-specific restriction protein A